MDIKILLREGLVDYEKRIIKEQQIAKNILQFLLEKEIKVGNELSNRLRSVEGNIGNDILSFLKSDNVKDVQGITGVDYTDKDNKTFTVYFTDNKGNDRNKIVKISKILKILGYDTSKLKDTDIESVINTFKQLDKTETSPKIKVVDGEGILWAYLCDNYDEDNPKNMNPGMGSCMRHQGAQYYLEIYTSNPDEVKCAVLYNPENNKILARALLWSVDSGVVIMDRIYYLNTEFKGHLTQYAASNNIRTSFGRTETVTLTNGGEYDEYPYLDTLMYYDAGNGVLSNESNRNSIRLQDTGGGFDEDGMVWSDVLGDTIHEDEATFIDEHGWVPNDEAVTNWDDGEYLYLGAPDVVGITAGIHEDEFGIDDELYHTYDDQWVTPDDEPVKIEAGYHTDDYALPSEITVTYDDLNSLSDEVTKIDLGEYEGEYAHDDDIEIDYEGNNILKNESVELDKSELDLSNSSVAHESAVVETYDGDMILKIEAKEITKGEYNGEYAFYTEVEEDSRGYVTLKELESEEEEVLAETYKIKKLINKLLR